MLSSLKNHPKLDTSKTLDQYQSLIESMQWPISLGQFNVSMAMMTLSSFQALPHWGHLDQTKHVVEKPPYKATEPLGNPAVLTHYVNASLYCNVLMGRLFTDVLHSINGTPIYW